MTRELQVKDLGAVRMLAIDRPSRRNALDVEVVAELRREIERADHDPSVGAVVLTGVGDHFSAGGDADMIVDTILHEDDEAALNLMAAFDKLVETIWTSPVPVVAAVGGVAYGAAFNIVLACDLVVCSRDARFCQIFVHRGVIPDTGGAWLLPRLVGMHRAKELMLLAGELHAEQALDLGVVNAVRPDAESARAHAVNLAGQIAAAPRFAVRRTKTVVNESATGSFEASLALESVSQAAALRSEAARRGFEEFVARRQHVGS